MLVVQRQLPLSFPTELILVPRSLHDGLLTALYSRLDHPSKQQLQLVIQGHFWPQTYILLSPASEPRHTCASLQHFPSSLFSQSLKEPPESVRVSFVADNIWRHRQFILLLRVHRRLHCVLPRTFRDAPARLIVGLHTLDGLHAVIRVDSEPRIVSLKNTNALQQLSVSVKIDCLKNTKKDPIAK